MTPSSQPRGFHNHPPNAVNQNAVVVFPWQARWHAPRHIPPSPPPSRKPHISHLRRIRCVAATPSPSSTSSCSLREAALSAHAAYFYSRRAIGYRSVKSVSSRLQMSIQFRPCAQPWATGNLSIASDLLLSIPFDTNQGKVRPTLSRSDQDPLRAKRRPL